MKKLILGLFALLVFTLPQIASAQTITISADRKYAAKFLCGFVPSETGNRFGVVAGHYNTIINLRAVKDRTQFAFRVTALSTNFEIEPGVPSGFSYPYAFDTDGGIGIVCNQIKFLLGVQDIEGFVEGFVTIYADRPLDVADVLSGEPETGAGVSVLNVLSVPEIRAAEKIKFEQSQ